MRLPMRTARDACCCVAARVCQIQTHKLRGVPLPSARSQTQVLEQGTGFASLGSNGARERGCVPGAGVWARPGKHQGCDFIPPTQARIIGVAAPRAQCGSVGM